MEIETGHALQGDDRRTERAEGDGRRVGDEGVDRGVERREPEPHEKCCGDGDRRAEPGGPLEECAE